MSHLIELEHNIRFFCSNASKTRLLWSRTGTPNSIPDSPKSVDSRSTARSRHSVSSSPLRLSKVPLSAGYDSDDSIRLDRANHSAMKQDIMSIKTMLLKLRRVLNEVFSFSLSFCFYCAVFSFFFACSLYHQQPDEDIVLRVSTSNNKMKFFSYLVNTSLKFR